MFLRRVVIETEDLHAAKGRQSGLFVSVPGILVLLGVGLVVAAVAGGYALQQVRTKEAARRRAVDVAKRQAELVQQAFTRYLRPGREGLHPSQAQAAEAEGRLGGVTEAQRLHLELVAHHRRREFAESLALADELLAREDVDEAARRDLYVKKAWAQYYLGDLDAAHQTIAAGLEEFPGFDPLAQMQADLLLVQKRYDEAEPVIEALVKRTGSPAALFARGNLLWARGAYQEAARAFRTVLTNGTPPLERGAAQNLALLYAEHLKDPQQAEVYLTVLMGLAPEGAATHATVGRVSLLRGNFERAETFLRRAHRAAPGSLDVVLGLSVLCLRTGREDEAARFLDIARELDPEAETLYHALAARVHGGAPPAPASAPSPDEDADEADTGP